MKMTELFAEYQRTSTLFTGACRVPGSGFAGSREFKRVVKWRISPVFIAWRISDVKAESRLTWRASATPPRIQLRGGDKPGRLWLGRSPGDAEPGGASTFLFLAGRGRHANAGNLTS